MRGQKTVLILGAGASKGFGLPLGDGLKAIIAKDLRISFDDFGRSLESGSYEIVDALRILVRDQQTGLQGDINPHRAVAVRISNAMGPSGSIDEYVERHRNDSKYSDCAKLAIAKAILEAERNSTIYFDYRLDDDDLVGDNSQSWLSMLLRDITKRLTRDEIPDAFSKLFIINFNYDRCIEHFSFLWLKQMYNFTEIEAAQICSRISIYHPYGKLGDLPYENPNDQVAFGEKITGEKLVSVASKIRTYSEIGLDDKKLALAQNALIEAKKLVFLGFGFHEQNMEILTVPESNERATIVCYATTKDVSNPRIELDKERIARSFRVKDPGGLFFDHVPDTCEAFWRQYGDVVSR